MKPSHVATLHKRLAFLKKKIAEANPSGEKDKTNFFEAEAAALEAVLLHPHINYKVVRRLDTFAARVWIGINQEKGGFVNDPVEAVLVALRPVLERHFQASPLVDERKARQPDGAA